MLAQRSPARLHRSDRLVTFYQRTQNEQILQQAEGYLELEMPEHALAALDRLSDRASIEAGESSLASHAWYLRGESLRSMECYEEALGPLEKAARFAPKDTHVHLARAWCYKRTGQLQRAIDSLEHALQNDPEDALVVFNLSCYWSLAGQKGLALSFLARALELDSSYRDLIDDEHDFDPIRSDPGFQSLTTVIV